jgi:hypothetical protein
MNAFARSLSTTLVFTLSSFVLAQAPIVRRAPSSPPPDAQYPDQQPQYSAPPTDQGQGQYRPQYDPQAQQQNQQPAPPDYNQMAQQGGPPPALLPPDQLGGLVNRIALYPDPLLAQTLTAATYSDEIPPAATWAQQHSFLHGDALSAAIAADNLPWDPSVLALLPFPSVLDMMARDPDWTGQLGNAVLAQRDDVMDAVQRLRRQAYSYGYLASNSDIDVIDQGGYIEVQPFNPNLYYVPIYDPLIVFGPPRPGIFVGGVIRFGAPVALGVSFGRFGWFGAGFGWGTHTVLIDHRPWARTYVNRSGYVHPYAHPYVRPAAPQVEHHEAHAPPPRQSHDNHDRH